MPNRILRDGILESQRVNRLDEEQENFYRRLMSIVDDYGRYEAHPALLRARLYPLRLDQKSEVRIGELVCVLVRERLVFLYAADGKLLLQLLDFRQQTRSDSKHPKPDDRHVKSFATHPLASADMAACVARAQQMIATAHLVGGVVGDVVEDVVVVGVGTASPTDDDLSPKDRRKPKDLAAVIAVGAAKGLNAEECQKFFKYNEARKWRAPKNARGDWRLLLDLWIERHAEGYGELKKNNSNGAAFDSSKPHAHTGGLPIVS